MYVSGSINRFFWYIYCASPNYHASNDLENMRDGHFYNNIRLVR